MDPRLVHHAPMYHGWTPLMKAVSKGHLEASIYSCLTFISCCCGCGTVLHLISQDDLEQ
jgi:hypothetical protein